MERENERQDDARALASAYAHCGLMGCWKCKNWERGKRKKEKSNSTDETLEERKEKHEMSNGTQKTKFKLFI